jgi:hypothetical protein
MPKKPTDRQPDTEIERRLAALEEQVEILSATLGQLLDRLLDDAGEGGDG